MESCLDYIGEVVKNRIDEEKDGPEGRKEIFKSVGLINLQSDVTSHGYGIAA
jgi:hypothetical protein